MTNLDHLRNNVWPVLESAYGLPAGLLQAIATVETGGRFDPRAYNPVSRAAGLFQLTPIALEQLRIDYGVRIDPMSPAQASTAAAMLIRRHLRMFQELNLALAAYNAGEGTVRKYLREVQARGSGRLPRETVRYIPAVLSEL